MRNGKVETDVAMMAELATLAAQVKFDFVRIFRGFFGFIYFTNSHELYLLTYIGCKGYVHVALCHLYFLSSFLPFLICF